MQSADSPRATRVAAGRSQLEVAAVARCSIPTVRAYELDRDAVRTELRERLDAIYRALEAGQPRGQP